MQRLSRLVLTVTVSLASTGCAISSAGPAKAFNEPAIKRSDVAIRRVAIVPNRLPTNLADPEYWRKRNFDELRAQLTARGYTVLDYETSVRNFEASGLPVEDTKSSRDKFAEAARQMGVDAVFVPYYGTLMETGATWWLGQSFTYRAVATYQVYHAASNQFVARIDTEGADGYKTGGVGVTIGGMLLGSLLNPLFEETETIDTGIGPPIEQKTPSTAGTTLGTLFGLVGIIADGAASAQSPQIRWGRAFDRAIGEAANAFSMQFPRASAPSSGNR